MIPAIAVLLGFQLVGEVMARAAGLTLPGPVIGMALFLAALLASPRLAALVAPTARGLLAHLSLLFVPAGVGIIGHLGRFGAEGPGLVIAIIASTLLSIAVGAVVFVAVARLTGNRA